MGETLRFDVIGRGDASDIRRLADAVELLIRRLRRLDNANARPDVDIDTRRAERNLGRFANEMHRRISRAIESLPDIDLDANASEAQRELAAIRAQLTELDDKQIGVDISSVEAERQIREIQTALDRLDRDDVDVQIRADAAAAVAELARVDELADNLDGRTVQVRVHTHHSFRQAINEIATFARNLRTLSIPVALTAITPMLGAISAAALDASQSLFLLPAASLAAGAAIGTLVLGFQNLGDALGKTDTKAQIKKVNKALAELAPSARELVGTLRGLAGAWNGLRIDVQQQLFQGVAAQVRTLADRYLPSLRSTLVGVAAGFNQAATSTAEWLSKDPQVQRLSATFDRVRQTVVNASGAVQPLVEAFVTLADVGSTRLPRLGQAVADAAARFRDWVNAAAESGRLGQLIDQGIASLRQLGQITINVGATLINVLRAADMAGAGMLNTLERVTGAMRQWTASAQGTATLVAVFEAIRTALNAVGDALAAFVGTGALQAAASALVALGRAVDGLLPVLGRVAGEAIVNLANAMSLAAAAVTPLLDALAGIVNALGPIVPLAVAAAVAFRALSTVGRLFTGLGASIATAALSMGVFTERMTKSAAAGEKVATVGSKLSQAFTKMGQALPFIGIALVGLAAALDEFGSKADQVAHNVVTGTQSFASAVRTELQQLNKNYLDVFGREKSLQGEFLAEAHRRVTAAVQEQLAAMGPMEQLQARVAMAQATLNDVLAESGGRVTPQAAAAARELSAAQAALAAAEAGANAAVQATNQSLAARVGAVQTALGATLQMEDALARVADAEKAANEAARQHGEGSTEAAAANRAFAQTADQAAQSVAQQAQALAEAQGAANAAEIGARAYATALVQTAATASGPARSALFGYIDTLTDAQLQALNAGVAASGFAIQVEKLPSGRTVLIAVDPQTGKVVEVKSLIDSIQDKTVTINGNAMPAQQALTKVLSLVAAGEESISINGQSMPAQQALAAVLGMITSASGTVTINGQSFPAEAALGALIASINSGSGTVTINGQSFPADQVLRALVGAINSSTATVTLDANGQPVASAKSEAEQPTQSPHTVGSPTTDNTQGPRSAAETPTANPHTLGSPTIDNTQGPRSVAQGPTGNPHTVGSPTTDNTAAPRSAASVPTANPHTVGSPTTDLTQGPRSVAQGPTANAHTVGSPIDTSPVDTAKTNAQQPTESMHTLHCDDSEVVDAKQRAEQPTESMHTIHCDDSAVRSAKAAAQRNTSSTHTIHVRVVGGGVPRAAGAFAVPRAQGAYAAPMAEGGMRRMSAARAEIVPPRQPRIIGDRMRGPEAFIPVNRSPRSRAILQTTANAMGFHLMPKQAADSNGLGAVRSATGIRMTGSTGGDGILSELRELSGLLRALRGDVDHHNDHAATASRLDLTNRLLARALAAQGAAAQTAQSWRTTAELGAF